MNPPFGVVQSERLQPLSSVACSVALLANGCLLIYLWTHILLEAKPDLIIGTPLFLCFPTDFQSWEVGPFASLAPW